MIEIPLRLRHRVRDANFSPTFHRYSADVGSTRGVYISTCNSVTTTYTTWWFSAALLNPHTFTTRFHEQIHLGFPARAMAFLLSVTSCTVASFCGASFRQVYHESYNQLLGKYSDFSIQDNMGYRVKKKKKNPSWLPWLRCKLSRLLTLDISVLSGTVLRKRPEVRFLSLAIILTAFTSSCQNYRTRATLFQ